MQIGPFGLIVLFMGVLSLFLDYSWTIVFAFALTVFAAAEGVTLTALGGATITPPHLFEGFLIAKALLQRDGIAAATRQLTMSRPGGWLALVVFYGIVVSILAPGLFPETLVYAFSRTENGGPGVRLEPLTSGSGQITQDVYAFGDVLLLATTAVLSSRRGAAKHVFYGFVACTALNLLFAVLDVGSYYAGYPDLLAFVRTGGYAQVYQNTEGGLKRIAGSFTETSSFSAYSCILLGFWGSLWMQRYRPSLSGTLAFFTLAALLLSTSSTAYVSVAIVLALFGCNEILSALSKKGSPRLAFLVIAFPLLIFLILAAALVHPQFVDAATSMIDEAVLNKANTASGIERFAWNSQAWQNFFDTYGLGIGIGGGRASSYPLILLSNVGLLGTLGYAVFVCKTLSLTSFYPETNGELAIGKACRWAFAGSLISATVSAGVFEIGVLPYLAAACAAAIGFKEAGTQRRRRLSLEMSSNGLRR